MIKILKAGYSAATNVKAAVNTVLHPVQAGKDLLLDALKSLLLKALQLALSEDMAQSIVQKLDVEGKVLPLKLSVTAPTLARSFLSDEDKRGLVQDVLNDVLAGPLEALGYRMASVGFVYDAASHLLEVTVELGLKRLVEEPVAAPGLPPTQSTTAVVARP